MEGLDLLSLLRSAIVLLPPLIFAITVHEVAHGWVASKFGDPTALMAGRLTLNPVKHVDPIGTIIVPVALYFFTNFAFGWAKPVPVAFNNLNNPRRDMIIVAAAGPASNVMMATIWAIVPIIAFAVMGISEGIADLLLDMSAWGIQINVILALFNMVPIPPLDGGRVLAGLLPPRQSSILDKIEPFGIPIVLLLMIFGPLGYVLFPAYYSVTGFFSGLSRMFLGVWGIG